MKKVRLNSLSLLVIFPLLVLCERDPEYNVIPASFVYSIVEHNDSIYYSTRFGEIFRFNPETSDIITPVSQPIGFPIRGLVFKKDGTLYISSYETGIHRLVSDSLVAEPKMKQMGWTMKLDTFDNIWMAGRNGVFRQKNDTLIKYSTLPEALDIDFYQGYLAVAHRSGVSLYDTTSGLIEKQFSSASVFWTLTIVDSFLYAGGVETCALIDNQHEKYIPIKGKYNIPWSIVKMRNGDLILGTQKGLYRVRSGKTTAKCIGFKGKCIKSLFIDSKGRLWVGRYFNK